ncbi:MAG TPA: FecR domain-containing protein [Parvibaculum sp.]
MKIFGRICVAATLIVRLYAPAAMAAGVEIGVAAAVKSKAESVIGGQTEPLLTGGKLVVDETVRTGPNDTAQLLFIDQTSLSVGPKSEVKLDKFVYDPSRAKGDVVIDASKGVFRFVSGSQDPHGYALKTPVATIGVRGTIVDFLVEDGKLTIILVEGWCEITLSDGTVVKLTDPGKAIVIAADGSVDGPKTWDGTYHNIVQVASFPLYGHSFEDDQHDADLPGDDGGATRQDISDELSTHGVDVIGGGGGGGNGGDGGGGCEGECCDCCGD